MSKWYLIFQILWVKIKVRLNQMRDGETYKVRESGWSCEISMNRGMVFAKAPSIATGKNHKTLLKGWKMQTMFHFCHHFLWFICVHFSCRHITLGECPDVKKWRRYNFRKDLFWWEVHREWFRTVLDQFFVYIKLERK